MASQKGSYSKDATTLGWLFIGFFVVFTILFWLFSPDSTRNQVQETPIAERTGAPSAYARVLNGASSDESFYLDGIYTPRITVVDSEENCVLSLFAREAGDGYGTEVFNDLVVGNAGSFPGPYRQTFTWDSVSFSGESVRFYNDGGCDEVQLFMNRE